MNIALWIVAGLLALLFLYAGSQKLTAPREKLAEEMSFVPHASDTQIKLLGLAEVLGAIGLILPAAVDIAPMLVPIAALCLVIVMVGGVAVHLKLGDPIGKIGPPIVFGCLALFVAVMRFGPQAF